MSSVPRTELLIASVPKVPGSIQLKKKAAPVKDKSEATPFQDGKPIADEVFSMRLTQDQIINYKKEWINTTIYTEQEAEVCDEDFCCNFKYKIQKIVYVPVDPPEYVVNI